jgi:hypothetical protein
VKPRGVEYTSDDELPMIGGHADGLHHPFELLEAEQDALAAELLEKLARKRPAGFQADWGDQPVQHLRIA